MPQPTVKMYEEIEHTADWALKVRGLDLPALFSNAALGLMDLAGVRAGNEVGQARKIELRAADPEILLVDWLQELILSLEMKRKAFRDIKLTISDTYRLAGSVKEVPFDSIDKPVKAVTFNDLAIRETPEGLEATIVFDV